MADYNDSRRAAARKLIGKTDLGMNAKVEQSQPNKLGMPKQAHPSIAMMAKGGSVRKKEMEAEKKPIMKAKGGPVKLAMGGVGKQRKGVSNAAGMPMKAPRSKMGR